MITLEPADNAQGVSPDIKILRWRRDTYCQRYARCEIWWGEQDEPNFWYVPGEAKKIMELADVNYIDLSAIPAELGGPISLEHEKEYYWAIKYEDANSCNWGAGLDTWYTWNFETGPASDINSSGSVELGDFGILSSQWQDVPSAPSADIAPAVRDNFVDMQDLKALARDWLWPL